MKSTKKTTDIYFASALIAMGATLENVDRTDLRHMEFELSFPLDNEPIVRDVLGVAPEGATFPTTLDELEKNWLNKKGTMGALYNMAEAIKRMKSVVHSK